MVVLCFFVCFGGFGVELAMRKDDIFLEGRLPGIVSIGLEVPTAQSYAVASGGQVPCWLEGPAPCTCTSFDGYLRH